MLVTLLTLALLQVLPTPERLAHGWLQPVGDFDAQHAVRVQQNPPNLRYSVSTDNGRTTFAVGELINVTQQFERTGPPGLNLSAVFWDRLEAQFVFDGPAPVVDARAEFQAWSPMGVVGSIGGSLPDFDGRYELRRTLNPRYSFRVPGRYRFFLTSSLPPQPVTSDIIEITIVPATPEWQAQELEHATREFVRAASHGDGWEAARRMRVLRTAAALSTMAHLLTTGAQGTVQQELRWGVQESPFHALALQELDAAVARASTHAVPQDVISTLALLALRVEEEQGDPMAERSYRDRVSRYEELLAAYQARHADRRQP